MTMLLWWLPHHTGTAKTAAGERESQGGRAETDQREPAIDQRKGADTTSLTL